MFGGFGPIVVGIVYVILSHTLADFSLSGDEVFVATLSSYLLAFIQAGASVFNQIEHWPLAKSLLCHFATLFVAYAFCYISNSWIPFEPMILLVFSVIFIVAYLIIWFSVYLSIKAASRKFNEKLG